MIQEDIGSMLFQLPPLEASGPGEGYHPVVGVGAPAPPGGQPYGPKMPPNKAAETNKQIEGIQKGIDASNATYLTLPVSLWHQIGVYGALAIIFLVGLVGLLTASGAVKLEGPGLTVAGPSRHVQIGSRKRVQIGK